MTKKLRVGILGSGWAGKSHAIAFSKIDNVSVTGVWSKTRSNGEAAVAELTLSEVQVYDTWEQLIDSNIDILSIACAQQLRHEAMVAAIDKGIHVLIEKPLSIKIEDAHAMVAAAEKAGVVVSVCLSTRYMPGIQMAKSLMQAGNIGQILNYQTQWRFAMTPKDAHQVWPWWTDETGMLGGGGSHEFDRIRYLTGADFMNITGLAVPFTLPHEPEYTTNGSYSLIATMSDGSHGWLSVAMTVGEPQWELLLNGSKGTLRVTNESVVQKLAEEEEAKVVDIPDSYLPAEDIPLFQSAWDKLIADFIEAVRTNDIYHESVPNLPTIHDGLHTQQMTAAALRTQDEKRWVGLSEFSG